MADKAERDRRRATRSKVTTQEWRDLVDRSRHPDNSLRAGDAADFRYVYIDTTNLDLTATIAQVTEAAPGMFKRT